MDKKELVNADIEGGREFVRELEREGLPISAAMWLKAQEQGPWQLYIASPDVEKHGPIAVYRFIDKVSARHPETGIKVDDVVAANTTNHFVNAIAGAIDTTTNNVVRFGNSVFNNVAVEEAVVYKVKRNVRPSPAPPKARSGGKQTLRA